MTLINIDLLKHELLDSINIHAVLTLPHILLPKRFTKTSTLTDNIFSHSTSSEETESANVASIFSDNLPHFSFSKRFFLKITSSQIR